jgi:CheY-like chemotaxis protein
MNEAIRDYHTLLRRAVGEAVEIRTALSPVPCRVHIDPVQFETAILNLAINARDAMPSGGILEIETAVCRGEPPGIAPGDHVRVTVRDHGRGMPAELVERAFEPFFTTKPIGKGTGLGLSQVYGFVRQSDGRVELESCLGKGTAVRIYLPLHSAPSRPEPERETAEPAPQSAAAETILVVEDDPDVRDIALSNLEDLGYRTLVAPNGAEALAMLSRTPEVDLLFTDLVMPGGVSGRELARAACRLRPGLKVLLTSGYAVPSEDDGAHEDFPLIPKPYRQRDLAAKIRDVLDGAAGAKRACS